MVSGKSHPYYNRHDSLCYTLILSHNTWLTQKARNDNLDILDHDAVIKQKLTNWGLQSFLSHGPWTQGEMWLISVHTCPYAPYHQHQVSESSWAWIISSWKRKKLTVLRKVQCFWLGCQLENLMDLLWPCCRIPTDPGG